MGHRGCWHLKKKNVRGNQYTECTRKKVPNGMVEGQCGTFRKKRNKWCRRSATIRGNDEHLLRMGSSHHQISGVGKKGSETTLVRELKWGDPLRKTVILQTNTSFKGKNGHTFKRGTKTGFLGGVYKKRGGLDCLQRGKGMLMNSDTWMGRL